jgi:hypothetical protein
MINVNLNFGRGHDEIGKFIYHYNEQVFDLVKDYLKSYVGEAMALLGHLQAFTGVDTEPVARELYQMWSKYIDHLSRMITGIIDEAGILADADLSRYHRYDMKKLHRVLDRYTMKRFKNKKRLLDRLRSESPQNKQKSLDKTVERIKTMALPNGKAFDLQVWWRLDLGRRERGQFLNYVDDNIVDDLYDITEGEHMKHDAHDWYAKHPVRSLGQLSQTRF